MNLFEITIKTFSKQLPLRCLTHRKAWNNVISKLQNRPEKCNYAYIFWWLQQDSSKEFLDIQVTTEYRFTLKRICDILRTHSHECISCIYFLYVFHDINILHMCFVMWNAKSAITCKCGWAMVSRPIALYCHQQTHTVIFIFFSCTMYYTFHFRIFTLYF